MREALRAGRILGAGLDVFAREPPPPDQPLFTLPNVAVKPHIAAGTVDAPRTKGGVLVIATYGFATTSETIDFVARR